MRHFRPVIHAAARALLGREPAQRIRLGNSLIALAMMNAGWAAVWFLTLERAADHLVADLVWFSTLLCFVSIYGLIRSGYSLRYSDPAMTSVQLYLSVIGMSIAYGVSGAARGAVFPVLLVTIVFSMFRLTAPAVRRLVVFTLLLFGAVGLRLLTRRAADFELEVELAHLFILTITLPVVALLAVQLSSLRARERQQRNELKTALDHIRELATRDELTGLVNRRHMQTLLDAERDRCMRSRRGLWVALIDLDHFKEVNDRHGHAGGDAALKAFADTALNVLRKTDVFARWGGEEFVLILPSYETFEAHTVLERLRGAIQAMRVPAASGVIEMTMSGGLVEMAVGESVQHLLARADRLLYEAKSRGRNQVLQEEDAPAPSVPSAGPVPALAQAPGVTSAG